MSSFSIASNLKTFFILIDFEVELFTFKLIIIKKDTQYFIYRVFYISCIYRELHDFDKNFLTSRLLVMFFCFRSTEYSLCMSINYFKHINISDLKRAHLTEAILIV